jgi:hypothetical protein
VSRLGSKSLGKTTGLVDNFLGPVHCTYKNGSLELWMLMSKDLSPNNHDRKV